MSCHLGVDGDDLSATAPHHEHPLQPLGQHLKELHVCNIKYKYFLNYHVQTFTPYPH